MRLYAGLEGLEERIILPRAGKDSRPSWFGFPITCREGTDRRKIVDEIEAEGIQTRMVFAGNLTKHPCFDDMRSGGYGYRMIGEMKNTDLVMADTFWVGVYPGMTDAMLDKMIQAVRNAVLG